MMQLIDDRSPLCFNVLLVVELTSYERGLKRCKGLGIMGALRLIDDMY
jgi:hypothetical protein